MKQLADYDLIVVNSSAGKDSQAMLDYVVELARAEGVVDRVIVAHADLGRVEWDGTAALAERQAKHYGLPFEKVSRPQGDLLQQVEARGMWPSNQARYCTSDHKRAQISKIISRYHRESGRKFYRVLNCQGIRAEESTARAKKEPFTVDKANTTKSRASFVWYPIFHWSLAQVWERIKASGVEHHSAYDLGMSRLSCIFCILAPRWALAIGAKHNPGLLREYAHVEQKTGHSFREDFQIASLLPGRQGELFKGR